MTPLFRHLLLTALLAGAAASSAAVARSADAPVCVMAMPEPSDSPQLRPTPRARCDYDVAELRRRMLRLLDQRAASISIEAVERLFGLPALTTVFDSEQSANYVAELSGPGAKTSWRVRLDFSESFFPMIPGRPKRFRGSLRPTRIKPGERGEVRLNLMLLGPGSSTPGSPDCISAEALTRAARPRWKDEVQTLMVMDAGPRQQLALTRGKLELSTDFTSDTARISELTLDAAADPPVPSITPAEEAQMLLRRAQGNADAVVAGLADAGDPAARRAYGPFYRDRVVASEGGRPDEIDARIDGLDLAALRALLKRVIIGSPWGAAREDCDSAIAEDDAPAALLRRARKRGLDPVEIRALESFCTVYLQGRVYRPPPPSR